MSELIPIDLGAQLPAVITRRTEIVASTLESIEQREIMQFFREFPDLGRRCIVRHYPLTQELIRRHADVLDWDALSRESESAIVFTDALIREFADRWKWTGHYFDPIKLFSLPRPEAVLSLHSKVPWSQELLDQYGDRIDWRCLSQNEGMPWSLELIEKYRDKWEWSVLSSNEMIPWNTELILEFQDLWNWSELSANSALPFTTDLIDCFLEKWNWDALAYNRGIDWTPPWRLRYLRDRAYQDFGFESDGWGIVCRGISFQNTPEEEAEAARQEVYQWLKRKSLRTDFKALCLKVRGSKEVDSQSMASLLLELFDHNQLSSDEREEFCRNISKDTSVPWTVELIEKFIGWWDWTAISLNSALPWSEELIEHFRERIFWGSEKKRGLSDNLDVPWSLHLLTRFEGYWNWGEAVGVMNYGISANKSIPWESEIFDRFEKTLNWDNLIINLTVPWSHDIEERWINYWTDKDIRSSLIFLYAGRLPANAMLYFLADADLFDYLTPLEGSSFCGNSRVIWSAELYRLHHAKLFAWSTPSLVEHQDFGVRKLTEVQIDALMAELFVPKIQKLETPQNKKERSRART